MRTNNKTDKPLPRTHGGAPASRDPSAVEQLRRSVMANLLWEDEFYESGEKIADRVKTLATRVAPADLAHLAIEARESGLRHVPLLLLTQLAKTGSGDGLVSRTIERVIRRADELAELVSLYWKVNPKKNDKNAPLSKQMKEGLARAFTKFDEYQLAKYNRDADVKLRDVLFLSHAKGKDENQKRVFEKLVTGTLETPDTWEAELSAGKDKRETFERLMAENKLGYMALLRNLRNMKTAGVPKATVRDYLMTRAFGVDMVFPFRFVAAAKAVPEWEDIVDEAFLHHMASRSKLPGKTIVVIDVSGSMYGGSMSTKSDMNRALAACALGAICRELCEEPVIYATAGDDWRRVHDTRLVPPRRGMALVSAIYDMCRPLGGGGIFLTQAIEHIEKEHPTADRVIVITDEQDCSGDRDAPSRAPLLGKSNYIINVASYHHGIGYERWTKINGFSEGVIRYISAVESNNNG